jgi:hypothetical protein
MSLLAGTLCLWFTVPFIYRGGHDMIITILGGLFMLLGGYAVVVETQSFVFPKAHSMMTGPDGLIVTTRGFRKTFLWEDIDKFATAKEDDVAGREKPWGSWVTFDWAGRKKRVAIDDTYGWERPEELVAYLYERKRKFMKKKSRQEASS